MYTNRPGCTIYEKTVRMFYMQIRICYGVNGKTYGCNKKSINVDYLEKIEERLKAVVIEHKNFDDLIQVYDRPETLFYCDPPYHKTEKYYDAEFLNSDHERLNACLKAIKGRFILSYSDDEYICDLYKDYDIIPVERQNNLSKGSYKELIIKNY